MLTGTKIILILKTAYFMKEKFYVVYLEDSKTGKCIDWGDLVDPRLTWLFHNCDDAHDFASLLNCFLINRFIPCVAEISSDSSTIYKER